MNYEEFLAAKAVRHVPTGIGDPPALSPKLIAHQPECTRWALQRGRAALFQECGLGKSWQALEWARVVVEHTQKPVLILTPLAVAGQFVREGEKLGVKVHNTRDSDVPHLCFPAIWVANYERLDRLQELIPMLGGVVLDESSILKASDGKTRTRLIETFRETRFRLCCTATPSPNDPAELGSHAEFLGVMRQVDMLQRFFEHDAGDTGDWLLKRHGRKSFWRWCSSWAMCVRKPSDLGYSDEGYALPPLELIEHIVDVDVVANAEKQLCFGATYEAATLAEQRKVRRASLEARIGKAAELVNADREQWIVWAALNDESAELAKRIDGAVEVTGSDPLDTKEERITRFLDGKVRVLVTKKSIAAWGINAQCCARQLDVGVDHSFEQQYQAIRRSWRFGQKRPVQFHQVCSSADGRVVANLRRKTEEFERMHSEMSAVLREARNVA